MYLVVTSASLGFPSVRQELIWFYQEGASYLFPDNWEAYLAPIPKVEQGDLISAYYRRLTGDNKEVGMELASFPGCVGAWERG